MSIRLFRQGHSKGRMPAWKHEQGFTLTGLLLVLVTIGIVSYAVTVPTNLRETKAAAGICYLQDVATAVLRSIARRTTEAGVIGGFEEASQRPIWSA